MDALLAFAAALVAWRLAGALLARWRLARRPELALWAASLAAYALAAGALAWGAAHGWDARAFRVYYLCGALITAPLLGAGSLVLVGRGWARAVALVYVGLATGIALAMPVHGTFHGEAVPAAQDHVTFVPARLVAVVANSVGAVAVLVVAIATFRRRPFGNTLIVCGVAVAAVGSAFGGLGAAGLAITIAVGAALLYAGFVAPSVRKGFVKGFVTSVRATRASSLR